MQVNVNRQKESELVALPEIKQHGWCKVAEIDTAMEEHERLMAMGICEGHVIQMIKAGNPMILKVFGSRIGLSARLAKRILVHPCERSGEALVGREIG